MKSLALASILAVVFGSAAHAQVNVAINTAKPVRVVDDRMFGTNTPFWDSTFPSAKSLDALTQTSPRFMRFGGGSATDEYDWETNKDIVSGDSWAFNIDGFAVQAKAIGAQAVITTNYGSGTPQEAANYVAYANTMHGYGFKYWEIGNECYGTWEYDTTANPHDPYTYATLAAQYMKAMRAVDPTIKIGVVASPGEDAYSNGYSAHPATNPRTNVAHNGWVPVMLTTLKSLGVMPDFLIHHRYEQNPGQESDAVLLQAALTWPADASNLRQMLTDYLGAAGAGVELLVTENNSVNSNPGKQSVSLVNGLYLADSTANLMQTEFNALTWWDFHNGQAMSTTQTPINLSASLYGWRMYADYGIENQPTNDRYPTFYIEKLLTHFARGGDVVETTTSDTALLSAYAVKRVDGSLSILVINKDPAVTYNANFAIAGYSPQATAAVYSYGIPQDTAAQTGSGSTDVAASSISNAGATFTASFAPYSATVLSLTTPTAAPAATGKPVSQTVANGSTVVFSFSASGAPTPTYQWFLNGSAVPSATSSSLVIRGATSANAGSYTCVATNSAGSVTSSAATLAVIGTANPGRLVNISCRATVGTGGDILIAGFAVGGAGTSGSQPLLIRASGPALAPFGVAGTLPDPQLQLYSGSTVLGTNDGWGGTNTIASAAAAVGAFGWSDPSSHDAALLETLAEGPYTAQVAGESGDTGVALAEVYDDTAAYTSTSPRIVNISARVQVGTGGSILIAGFAIGGSTSRTVLIRASGPALAGFGVPGTLPDPQLQLYSGTTVLESNSGWAGNPQISATAASVGAFPWSSSTSLDSAILATLPPGPYTAQVSGASGDTGVALVEVYEVP